MKYFLQKIFSVKNENGHKVWTVLGFKIKSQNAQEVINIQTMVRQELQKLIKQDRVLTPQAMISYMEVHITEHCNLNCQSCSHFSTLADEEFLSAEIFEKDMKRLSELTLGQIQKLMILGGEPLLHPDCCKFLEIARKYLPYTNINLLTNGILLDRQPDDFWSCLASNNITLMVTKYPINIDLDKIFEKCEKYKISFLYADNLEKDDIKISYKFPLDLQGSQDSRESFTNCCCANSCIQLVNGKLYTCCTAAYIRHFNKFFNQNLVTTKLDYIDIYEAKNYREILEFLAKPIPFCRYCNPHANQYGIPWQTSKKEITEWV